MRIALIIIGMLTIIGACVGFRTYHSSSDEIVSEIIAAVTAARESIQEFDIKYTMSRIQGGGNAVDWESHHFRYLDGMAHLNRSYSFANSDVMAEWDFGYDGTVRWQSRGGSPSIAIAMSAEAAEGVSLDAEGAGFTDMMLWYPCHEARFGTLHDRDLLSMLASGQAVVRPETELVGNAECVVVEFGDWYGKDFTIWLDPDRGHLPVLQRSHSAVGYELRIDEAAEVAPGVWMPVVGTRLVGAHPDVPELAVASEYRMEVEFVHVNTGVLQHEDFDHMNWAPPGTRVFDLDTGELWMVSARDFSEAADAVLAQALLPIQERDSGKESLSTAAPWRNAYWLALMVGCALTSGWLFLKGRR